MRSCTMQLEVRRLRRPPLRLARAATCVLGVLAAMGCEVTPEQIETWKGTEKGPGKLLDALRGDAVKEPLRAQAAAALIEIGRGPQVQETLSRMPESERRAIVPLLLPLLLRRVEDGTATGTATVKGRAPAEAKDGLFRLRPFLSASERERADQALVAWTTADLLGRMSAGSIGTETILTTIGSRAQEPLLQLLRGRGADSPEVLPAASLLGRLADAEGKRRGAEALLRLLPPPSPKAAIGIPTGTDGLLRALALLGGPAARDYLLALVQGGPGPPTLRGKALSALGEGHDPAALEPALRLAADRREAAGVREAAFYYLERIGPIAVPGLCRIAADPQDPGPTGTIARFRAVEAALTAGGPAALAAVLAALPQGRDYDRDDLTAYVAHRVTALGPGALPALREQLAAKSWVARAAALLALSELGTAEDRARMLALENDGTRLRGAGWQAATVGALARALARDRPAALRDKK